MVSDSELATPIYRLLAGSLSLAEFEQWVYATPQLEAALTPAIYLDVLGMDYRQPGARRAISAVLEAVIDREDYARWFLRQTLRTVAALDDALEDALVTCYDLYCHGAAFLQPLAIGYGLSIVARDTGETLDLAPAHATMRALAVALLDQVNAGLPLHVRRLVPLEVVTGEPAPATSGG